ncbi:hypothetical protein D3C77_695650 [compost metagenome]
MHHADDAPFESGHQAVLVGKVALFPGIARRTDTQQCFSRCGKLAPYVIGHALRCQLKEARNIVRVRGLSGSEVDRHVLRSHGIGWLVFQGLRL